jgi:hypothetical protein
MRSLFKKLGLLAFILCLMFAPPLYAAVTANSAIVPQTPNRGVVQFLQGTDSAGTYKTLYTAGSSGSIITGIYLTTSDATATHLVTCQVVNNAVKYGGNAVTTVLGAGFTTNVPAQNFISPNVWPGLPIDQNGNPYLLLISGDTLQCTFATNLTSATVINLVAVAADF